MLIHAYHHSRSTTHGHNTNRPGPETGTEAEEHQAQPQAEAQEAHNGEFLTISMELHEWKDPFRANMLRSGTTIVDKGKSLDRGYTAAEAAGDYHQNGACFAAWPFRENGGVWRSMHANLEDW